MGSEKRPFTVHAAVIAYHSKALGAMINGSMAEAREGCAVLEDVDEQTFVRFSEYAYTGDYPVAEPIIVMDPAMIVDAEEPKSVHPQSEIDIEGFAEPKLAPEDCPGPIVDDTDVVNMSWNYSNYSRKQGKRVEGWNNRNDLRSKKEELWRKLESRKYYDSPTRFSPRKNKEACENYSEIFLSHARLYVFAEKWGIDSLIKLCLHKLQHTLVAFDLYDKRVGDIFDLLDYTYTNTGDGKNSTDELRTLVVRYAACKVEILTRNQRFRALLESQSLLSADLVQQLIERWVK